MLRVSVRAGFIGNGLGYSGDVLSTGLLEDFESEYRTHSRQCMYKKEDVRTSGFHSLAVPLGSANLLNPDGGLQNTSIHLNRAS